MPIFLASSKMKASEFTKQSTVEKNKTEEIIQRTLKISPERFFIEKENLIFSNSKLRRVQKNIDRYKSGEPIEYIFFQASFNGNIFFINKNVLIPRPETELILQKTFKIIGKKKNLKILEIGTGSGALIISLAKRAPYQNYFATDISKKALKIAQKNSLRHNTKINFIVSNLLESVNILPDIIIANLPYLNKSEARNLADPKRALVSPGYPTYLIEKLLMQISKMNRSIYIILEIGYNQQNLKKYCKKLFPKSQISIMKDPSGYNRVLAVTN
ncbi:hypothetical protein COT77_03600 [Candidatus Berkelbacteria bacterium CG10_big_fil_rev_8_21_14_0_10_41_12]|uniref:peptide chain release factor N(5)-glutamine methyltransferase n=1 Tax=Candidatus Berkelbacteria bacterium CG10_big_fil_rev_8_21_14_0_10_41_12 TaxID=1974513 RepID=A0A2M6WW65_9BACT|nr:MAG: hypothetical protein COT77_03600 [Candidatus Berkelbacteria bacterium CG10_big_fil_rev_8_21_14_0_10_41_12]